jgi:hypothetical protein
MLVGPPTAMVWPTLTLSFSNASAA